MCHIIAWQKRYFLIWIFNNEANRYYLIQIKTRTYVTLKENGIYLQKEAVLFGELYFHIFNLYGAVPESYYRTSPGKPCIISAPSVDDWAAAICIVVEVIGVTFS